MLTCYKCDRGNKITQQTKQWTHNQYLNYMMVKQGMASEMFVRDVNNRVRTRTKRSIYKCIKKEQKNNNNIPNKINKTYTHVQQQQKQENRTWL